MDDYCDNGFACCFHFISIPPTIKHMKLKLSTLHSRVLDLFDAFPRNNYKHWVFNLHTFVNFAVQSLKHEVHVVLK